MVNAAGRAVGRDRHVVQLLLDADLCLQRRRDRARAARCGDEAAGGDDADDGDDTLVAFGLTPVGLTLDVSLQLRQWLMDALDLAECHCYHDFVAARCELEDYDVDDAIDGDRASETQVATAAASVGICVVSDAWANSEQGVLGAPGTCTGDNPIFVFCEPPDSELASAKYRALYEEAKGNSAGSGDDDVDGDDLAARSKNCFVVHPRASYVDRATTFQDIANAVVRRLKALDEET